MSGFRAGDGSCNGIRDRSRTFDVLGDMEWLLAGGPRQTLVVRAIEIVDIAPRTTRLFRIAERGVRSGSARSHKTKRRAASAAPGDPEEARQHLQPESEAAIRGKARRFCRSGQEPPSNRTNTDRPGISSRRGGAKNRETPDFSIWLPFSPTNSRQRHPVGQRLLSSCRLPLPITDLGASRTVRAVTALEPAVLWAALCDRLGVGAVGRLASPAHREQ